MPTDPPVVDLDRGYRQRAAATRAKKTTEAVLDAAELALLTRLSTHPSDPLSQLTMSEFCELADLNRTTVLRRFKTVEAVGAAVAKRMRARKQPVPAQIAELAERHALDESWKNASRPVQTPLAARISGKNPTVDELRSAYEAALARTGADDDQTEVIYWCTELAEKYYEDCRRQDLVMPRKSLAYLDLAKESRDYAERGLGLVDSSNDTHCMLGFRLTQTAARAELLLSTRDLDYETTGLSRIRSLKDIEITLTRTLGWELKAELAKFHRDRSAALGDDRVGPEIASIRKIVSTLLTMCQPAAQHDRPPLDTVPADELSGVIARLCAIEMAYAGDDRYAASFRAAFPDGTKAVKTALLECFSCASGTDARQERSDIAGLIRLQDLGVALDKARRAGAPLDEAITDYEQAPVDLLRTARFGIIRHVLVARYLASKAETKLAHHNGTTAAADGSPTEASSTELFESAVYFYAYAEAVTRRRGAGGKLRDRASHERQQLIDDHPDIQHDAFTNPQPVPMAEFRQFQQAINDLVLRAFTWRARLDDDAVRILQDLINPIERYLERSQK